MADGPVRSSAAVFAAGAAVGATAAAAAAAAVLHSARPPAVSLHADPRATTGADPPAGGCAAAWRSVLRLLGMDDPNGGPGASSREVLLAAAESRARTSVPSSAPTPHGTTGDTRSGGSAPGFNDSHRLPFGGQVATHAAASAAEASAGGQARAPLRLPGGEEEGGEGLWEEDEVLAEHFTRNTQFFGAEGQRRVAGAFVIVVGLGVPPPPPPNAALPSAACRPHTCSLPHCNSVPICMRCRRSVSGAVASTLCARRGACASVA